LVYRYVYIRYMKTCNELVLAIHVRWCRVEHTNTIFYSQTTIEVSQILE
jgi:hypothetical protein